MTYSSMRIDRKGELARPTFIQPARGNPIDGTFCDVANELSSDPTVRALRISAATTPLDAHLELVAQAPAYVAGTADAREGLTAFAAKRKAAFTGL